MRVRISLTVRLERTRPAEQQLEHEHRDNDGTLVELGPGDRYVGFRPVEQ